VAAALRRRLLSLLLLSRKPPGRKLGGPFKPIRRISSGKLKGSPAVKPQNTGRYIAPYLLSVFESVSFRQIQILKFGKYLKKMQTRDKTLQKEKTESHFVLVLAGPRP
jgi:hypothetical protein